MENVMTFEQFSYNIDDDILKENILNDIKKWLKLDDASKEKKAIDAIMNHPQRKIAYEQWKKEDPSGYKAAEYVKFYMKHPQGHPQWSMQDNPKGSFIDRGEYKQSGHVFGSGS